MKQSNEAALLLIYMEATNFGEALLLAIYI